MKEDGRAEGRTQPELAKAWPRFVRAERRSLRARAAGGLARALSAPP